MSEDKPKGSWFKTGWDATREESKKSPFENKGPQRIWMPAEETKRVIFLDEDPTTIWEHGFKMNGKWGNFEPCRKKQRGLGDGDGRCPICDCGDKMFPTLTCFFSVIDMTAWRTKKDDREVCFIRKVFACRMGSEEKPGIAKKLDRLRQQHGGLTGCVFDVYRSGTKTESCGDEFTFKEKHEGKEAIEKFAREQVGKYVERVNAKLPAKDHLQLDKVLQRNPWRPINFEKLYETEWAPRSLKELDRLFSTGGAGRDSDDFGGEGAGGSDDGGESPY